MIQAGGLVHPIRCKQCGTPGKVFSNSQLLERNKHLWQVYLSTLMECKTRQASSAWQGTTMLPSMCMRAVSSEFGFRFVSQTCIGKEFKSLNFSWKKELKGCKGRSCHPGTSSHWFKIDVTKWEAALRSQAMPWSKDILLVLEELEVLCNCKEEDPAALGLRKKANHKTKIQKHSLAVWEATRKHLIFWGGHRQANIFQGCAAPR